VDFLVSIIISNLWTPDADPLWGWLIGPPGSFKTELTRTLEEYRHVKYLSSVSPAALCSGYDPDKSHEDVSLLKHLDRKILVIKDFTVMLSAKESDIQKIFGDLRDAFDGSFAKWFGTVGWRRYKAKFGVIAAVTPEIDNFTIQHIVLGERFLSLRVCRRGLRDRRTRLALLRHVREAIPAKARWRQALKTTWHNNLDAILEGLPGTVDLPEDYGVRIELLSDLVATLRALPSLHRPCDTGIEPELGSRLVNQFINLALARCAADGRTVVTADDLHLVLRVAVDTLPPLARRVFQALLLRHGDGHITTRQVAKDARLTVASVRPVLLQYSQVGLVSRDGEDGWRLLDDVKAQSDDAGFTSAIESTTGTSAG